MMHEEVQHVVVKVDRRDGILGCVKVKPLNELDQARRVEVRIKSERS